MNILITGGTGFIGRHLISALIGQGFHCTCLVRAKNNVHELGKLDNTEIVCGDIVDKRSLRMSMRNVQVIYHLAGQVGDWGVPNKTFFDVNVEGTRNLLDVAREGDVQHFIFCSTPGVQGKGYVCASETLPYNPPHEDESTKAEAEKLLLDFSERQTSPRVTIVRPDFVYGPGDLRRLPLYRAIKHKRFFQIGSGAAFLHPTFVEDVARAFCLLPNNPISFGQIYNIAGPRKIRVKEYLKTIAETLHVSLPRVRVPIAVARLLSILFETASRITVRAPFLSSSRVDFLTKDHGSDISKAKAQLGFKPQVDLREGMRRTIEWYYAERLL